MSSIIDSLSSLISSILDIFKSIFMTIYHSLASVLSIFTDSISSIANLGGDFAGFLMSKLFLAFLDSPGSGVCVVEHERGAESYF